MTKRNIIIKKKNGSIYDELYPITTASNVILGNGQNVESQLGDMSQVPTTSKTASGAITELFTNVSNGKTLVGTAITDIDNSVVVPTNPTFQNLADAIGSISTGKKYITSTGVCGNGTSMSSTFIINIPFTFSLAKIKATNGSYASDYFIQRIRLNRYVEVYGIFSSGHLTASSGTQNLALITKDTLLTVTENSITLKYDATSSISGYNYLFNPSYTFEYTVYE